MSGFFNHSLVPLIADMLAGVRLCRACSMLTVPVAWYVEASVHHYEQWKFSLAAAGAVREVVYFQPAFFSCRLLDQVLERGLTWRYGELWVERLVGEFKKRTRVPDPWPARGDHDARLPAQVCSQDSAAVFRPGAE